MNASSQSLWPAVPDAPVLHRAQDSQRVVHLALAGLACLPIGLLWDISHHSTIGRDTFWTPAHILIQLGGILPAMVFAMVALKTTFGSESSARDAAVSFWGFRAPLGVWLTAWGALAMVTSAPFDDWWHNRYGLDVKIISPPHAILGLGMFAVGLGVLCYAFSLQNRSGQAARSADGLVCAVAVGVMTCLWADFATEYTWPNLQHGSRFYAVIATPFPLLLVLAARAARVPGAATIAAATYMAIYIGMILVLPLFPAQPKLAPVYHPVDHMVPPAFPILLVVPAMAIDLIVAAWTKFKAAAAPLLNQQPSSKRTVRWWHDWLLAIVIAAVFVTLTLAVQWPFSTFLLSDAADNRFFARSGHWPYFAQPGAWMNGFFDLEKDPLTPAGLGMAFARGFISARLGLWLGNYLLRLKR